MEIFGDASNVSINKILNVNHVQNANMVFINPKYQDLIFVCKDQVCYANQHLVIIIQGVINAQNMQYLTKSIAFQRVINKDSL